ncbi:hypothetical protein KEJ50_01025 [Candidatus Bathyarchaeota archaeon]|nr:hypothetical protein [Candidatus Bathyarchaeota archaeon]
MLQELYLAPVTFNFKVRRGAKQICIECFWLGAGSIEIKIQALNKVYTEKDMKVIEKTTIHASGLTVEYQCYKKCLLSIPSIAEDEFWRLELTLLGVSEYQLAIEIS